MKFLNNILKANLALTFAFLGISCSNTTPSIQGQNSTSSLNGFEKALVGTWFAREHTTHVERRVVKEKVVSFFPDRSTKDSHYTIATLNEHPKWRTDGDILYFSGSLFENSKWIIDYHGSTKHFTAKKIGSDDKCIYRKISDDPNLDHDLAYARR